MIIYLEPHGGRSFLATAAIALVGRHLLAIDKFLEIAEKSVVNRLQ